MALALSCLATAVAVASSTRREPWDIVPSTNVSPVRGDSAANPRFSSLKICHPYRGLALLLILIPMAYAMGYLLSPLPGFKVSAIRR